MDDLFLKEVVFRRVSMDERYIEIFLDSIGQVQSRKIYNAFLLRITQDITQVEEVLMAIEKMNREVSELGVYKRERFISKFNGERLFEYILSKPISIEEYSVSLQNLAQILRTKIMLPLIWPMHTSHLDLLMHLARQNKVSEMEMDVSLKKIDFILAGRIDPVYKYVEEVLILVDKYISIDKYIEQIKERVLEKSWPYTKAVPAQRVLLALLQKEPAPYEYFSSRSLNISRHSPFFIEDIDPIAQAVTSMCAMQLIDSEQEIVQPDINANINTEISKHQSKYQICPVCNSLVNIEHIRYLRMHKIQIESRQKQLLDKALTAKGKNLSLILHGISHLKECNTLEHLKYVIESLKKAEKRQFTQEQVGKLFQALHFFSITKEKSNYLVGISKSACNDRNIYKIITSLNILYHMPSSICTAFSSAVLSHQLLIEEEKVFTSTIILASSRKHKNVLRKQRPFIFSHFLFRLQPLQQAMKTLSYIYADGSLSALLNQQKYYLAPRLWQIGQLETYYKDSPEIGIFYAIYICESKDVYLSERQCTDIGATLAHADAVAIVYTAAAEPEKVFKRYSVDEAVLLTAHSLMSTLFAVRKVLEEKIIPRNNCIFFSLMHIVQIYFSAGRIGETDIKEVFSFLAHTGHLTGTAECDCNVKCYKSTFWLEFVKRMGGTISQYKYIIALEIEKEHRKVLCEGKDESMCLEDATSLSDALRRLTPYLMHSTHLSALALRKVLPQILSATVQEISMVVKSSWSLCRAAILQMLRLYIDTKDPRMREGLSQFGLLGMDALEEGSQNEPFFFLQKEEAFMEMEHASHKEIVNFFVFQILIPLYYDTMDDILLYVIQEILKTEEIEIDEKSSSFMERLRVSKYTLEIENTETKIFTIKSIPYKKGISHKKFLMSALSYLSQINGVHQEFVFLKDVLPVLNGVNNQSWPERHILLLARSYLFLLMLSLRNKHPTEIKKIFIPALREIEQGGQIDREIPRIIISSSLCFSGIFTNEELLLCGRYLKDNHYIVWVLERILKSAPDIEKDQILTDLQKALLALNEKDAVIGINESVSHLTAENLAAEFDTNNNHACLLYLNEEILHKTSTKDNPTPCKDIVEMAKKEGFDVKDALGKVEKSLRQWTDFSSPHLLSNRSSSMKTFILHMHLLKDCEILQRESLPSALSLLKERRVGLKTHAALDLSFGHLNILSLFNEQKSIDTVQKDALISAIRCARKAERYELAEKLVIRSILCSDWRVFYEKARLHLIRGNKGLAKQSLRQLIVHSDSENEYVHKALVLSAEVEQSEETYKRALEQIKTNERLFFGYAKYLEKRFPLQAFKMYCTALHYGTKRAQEIVPKLIHYIADVEKEFLLGESVKECVVELEKTAKKIDISVFLPYFVQIVTRLQHRDAAVEKVLSSIAVRLLEAFPGETLWKSLSVVKNELFPSKSEALLALIASAKFSVKYKFGNLQEFANRIVQISTMECRTGKVSLKTLLRNSFILYKGVAVPCSDFQQEIVSISDSVYVFSTLQRPKKIRILTSSGTFRHFLCKPKDDLRKDARFMDLSALLNFLFNSDTHCRGFLVRTYTVIPITLSAGIIEYIEETQSLKAICDKLYQEQGIDIKKQLGRDGMQRCKIGDRLAEILKNVSPVFGEFFRRAFPSPVIWMHARKRYVVTYAVMNAVGYLMGLGDRHGENILFDCQTGETVHVDLNCIFDQAKSLSIPETVPFRLTQNIVDAFGPTREEGQYRISLEKTLKFLSQRRDLIIANLRGFVHDPLGEWTGRNNSKTAIQVINATEKKIRFDDEIAKADFLIKESTSLKNLSEMFIGWLPFL